MFPEHFAENITNQADQIKRAFEVLAQARQDMTQVISAENMTPDQLAGTKADAYDQVISMANQIREKLQQNISTAAEGMKNSFDLEVDINTEKIVSDIRNAIQSATGSEDAVKIDVKINDEELLSQMRSAISQLTSGDEPVQVDIQINKQSLEADLEAALKDVELPIKFKIDSEQIAADLQAAVDKITDVEINLKVNTESVKNAVDSAVMVLDEAGENYQVAGGKTMEDFAEGMNLAMPMVQAAFGEMSEFGANWDWSDEGIKTMGDMAVAANEAAEALRNVKGNEDLKINLDVSDLQTTEEKCSALDQTISEMNGICIFSEIWRSYIPEPGRQSI